MNRTLKDATVRRYHYESHDQLRNYLADFVTAYNFARRLKTLKASHPTSPLRPSRSERASNHAVGPHERSTRLDHDCPLRPDGYYGLSNARNRISWLPRDSADDQAAFALSRVSDDPVTERYQGGAFVSVGYSRADFAPGAMFTIGEAEGDPP